MKLNTLFENQATLLNSSYSGNIRSFWNITMKRLQIRVISSKQSLKIIIILKISSFYISYKQVSSFKGMWLFE